MKPWRRANHHTKEEASARAARSGERRSGGLSGQFKKDDARFHARRGPIQAHTRARASDSDLNVTRARHARPAERACPHAGLFEPANSTSDGLLGQMIAGDLLRGMLTGHYCTLVE